MRKLYVKREFCGLIYSKVTKKVIARRYHNFFNIGEKPETHESKVDLSKSHVILVKFEVKDEKEFVCLVNTEPILKIYYLNYLRMIQKIHKNY